MAPTQSNPPLQILGLKSLSLKELSTTIQAQLKTSASTTSRPGNASENLIVVIDGLDFVLASQPEADALGLQQLLSQIRPQAKAVILTCSADTPLLHNRHAGATPLERQHSTFVSTLGHQASWIFQLRALDTGAAKDVTGVLRVSKGGSHDQEEGTASLEDGEWLYQLKGDGSARVWSRGQ